MKNDYIRSLYSYGFSSIDFCFYKTNLSVCFKPWIVNSSLGENQYDSKKFIVTTISTESTASLYYLAQKIIAGEAKTPLQYVIECNKQATLRFEFDGENTVLIIEKNGEKIVFGFLIDQYCVKEEGKVVTKPIHSGLIAFTEILQAYLIAVSADRQQEQRVGTEGGMPQMSIPSTRWR